MPGLQHLALVLLSIGLPQTWAERTGPVVVGQTFMAGGIEPACDCSDPWALTSHGISEKLFTVNKDGDIVGQVAESVVKVSDAVCTSLSRSASNIGIPSNSR